MNARFSVFGMLISSVLLITTLATSRPLVGTETVQVNGRVTDVTLFQTQARVTRTVVTEGRAGEFELVVSELPENIVADSLFAEGLADTEIRAVQFRTRAVGQRCSP